MSELGGLKDLFHVKMFSTIGICENHSSSTFVKSNVHSANWQSVAVKCDC